MGKRKYENNKELPSKKNKLVQSEETVDENVEVQPQNSNHNEIQNENNSKKYSFNVKHFRKELSSKQGQTMVLTQFLQVCLNPDNEVDYILEYLKAGGNSHEILRQVSQENKKNLTLATPAFHIFYLIILKVQSSLPHMLTVTEEACRYFLNTFMSTIEIMISENSSPRHRKIVLKLLTSMVTLNPDLGIEVLNQAPLTPKHLQYITEKANYKEKDNVRTAFVHFVTSFLIDSHLPLIKALLEKQGLLALVIPGLVQDDAEAVLIFLNILKKNVIDNVLISKSLKLKMFSHQVLHNMFKIYMWKGPPELSFESKKEMRLEITSLLSEIVITLFTSSKLGLYFTDNSLGTGDTNKNQNLFRALLTLNRPWEIEEQGETLIQIVYKCPDLHRAIISIIEHSFEPNHSPIWERTIKFFNKLMIKLKPEDMLIRMLPLSTTQGANFIRFMTLPVPILKFIHSNLGKDHTISLYCVNILVKMLDSLKRYIQILGTDDLEEKKLELKNKLEYFFPKHLPPPSVLVKLIQDVIKGKLSGGHEMAKEYSLPQPSDVDSLISLVDLLLLYNDIHPVFFETIEGSLDIKKMLEYSNTLKGNNISVLKFKIVSLWLMLDNSAINLHNPMFKDLLVIMLDVYTSDADNTWIEAEGTLRNFLKNTSIFEGDEDEINLMLYALRNSSINPTSLIADIIEYVLNNIKDLTDYIRNQIVHFEISDAVSESHLTKLFNDLSENKSTEDSAFLETKMPSPFIVGSIQYIQIHKDHKKNLKQFLSLYVANLLHANYSPELTEVLIGDCKLDVRNYVASWIGKPVALPDLIIGKENTLKNMSKSIVENENIELQDIFPYIEVSTEDDYDFVIKEVQYKVQKSEDLDSAKLLIWAKYLTFCLIKLATLNNLKDTQGKKITDYYNTLLAICKKYHMNDTCRSILMNLCKNPNFLKIYKPLDTNINESTVLATEIFTAIIVRHSDVIQYLNKYMKLLKPYKQKNYDEIIKAFIKLNKKKNVNADLTIKVLQVIGLSKEDDFRVLNEIVNKDINSCVKEDKEPSIVLEILRVLIERYTDSLVLELTPNILKNIMKLYTSLLTNKEVMPNLMNLEIALTHYFENNPSQAKHVSDDYFKQFFYANAMRKSTSQLAAVLLRFNQKYCNIFKEQIERPEILSLRELTLPLGNAALVHDQFLLDNKEFLVSVYGEYNANIFKMLEKPHKAGQTYISCWKFVKKLIIECMDFKDCQKFYSRVHKFETVELSHIHLLQAVFLKLCFSENKLNKEHLVNYFLNVIQIISNALKESKETEMIQEIVTNIHDIIQVTKSIQGLTITQDEFKKVTESSVWQNFCKLVLKESLKLKKTQQEHTFGPQLLHLLTKLVKLFYPDNHGDIVTLFDMVTSHSEFLNLMLSYHSSSIKSRLIEFIYILIRKNEKVMKSQHIPVYLSAYHATRSPCDRLILNILHFYETHGQPVNEYKPYVYGDSAANHYAVRKNRNSSLWAHPTPNQVLNLFEKDIIEKTVIHFPVTQKLEYNYEIPENYKDREIADESFKNILLNMSRDNIFKRQSNEDKSGVDKIVSLAKYNQKLTEFRDIDLKFSSHLDVDENIYDPAFLFPVLSHLLAPGSVASCFRLFRYGLFSVTIMALSSYCPSMRAAGYHILHRFYMLLETETRHKNDKLLLTDFMETLRNSLSTAITHQNGDTSVDSKNPRLPVIDALYLARALMVSTAPFDPLYKPVNNFLIAKQIVDLTVVPDFLSLFHDSDVEISDRRVWILDVIKDGTKSMTDVNVIFKTMCLKMIMDFYSSVLSDKKTKERILSVLNSLVAIPRAFEILVEGHGLMSWLHSAIRQLRRGDKSLVKALASIVRSMQESLIINSFSKSINIKNGKSLDNLGELKINKEVEHEIFMMLFNLTSHLTNFDVEDVMPVVQIFELFSQNTIIQAKKHLPWLINMLRFFVKDEDRVEILLKVLKSNDSRMLRSDILLNSNNVQSRRLIKSLISIVNHCFV